MKSNYENTKGVFGSIYGMERKWNQIRRDNSNDNYYFVKSFDSYGKRNYIIYDSLSFYLFHLYKQKNN